MGRRASTRRPNQSLGESQPHADSIVRHVSPALPEQREQKHQPFLDSWSADQQGPWREASGLSAERANRSLITPKDVGGVACLGRVLRDSVASGTGSHVRTRRPASNFQTTGPTLSRLGHAHGRVSANAAPVAPKRICQWNDDLRLRE